MADDRFVAAAAAHLEQRVGQVLVVREKPCIATQAGIPLLRLAAQTAMLESEALAEMGGGGPAKRPRIAIAVNADSMSIWFTAVLGKLPDVLVDIRIEDQDHSARLLREGAVMGAVITVRTPVPGCWVWPNADGRAVLGPLVNRARTIAPINQCDSTSCSLKRELPCSALLRRWSVDDVRRRRLDVE